MFYDYYFIDLTTLNNTFCIIFYNSNSPKECFHLNNSFVWYPLVKFNLNKIYSCIIKVHWQAFLLETITTTTQSNNVQHLGQGKTILFNSVIQDTFFFSLFFKRSILRTIFYFLQLLIKVIFLLKFLSRQQSCYHVRSIHAFNTSCPHKSTLSLLPLRPVQTMIKLHKCAGWSRSALFSFQSEIFQLLQPL